MNMASSANTEQVLAQLFAVEELQCTPIRPLSTCSGGDHCTDVACDADHGYEEEESPGDVFLGAAVDNDVMTIRRLIEKMGVSPSHANPAKQSALHLAALWGNGMSYVPCLLKLWLACIS